MGTVLSLLIVAVALFTAFALKKFYDKPYIVNFSLAVMLLLIVVRTLLLQPINTLGYVAIALCSIAFIFQAVLGIKNVKTQEQV
ncbi:hypothetical protein HF394_18275 [Planococcus glaciei]|uniref:Uncharacterized protein n=1 Tax=Planococcus glaciei TaxID=459472 RepID=A0A7H8QFN4_9BACL|nr:hypothetical protein [Planococcus glaciei]ETP70075.1 hypothetical protein G159_03870 [Planococcus glaciei CHR43]QDY46681.1 hypothetical protein FK545_19055 [Planococcus glaciei]QKX52362.1 hypothetical protein HF394_18275 [Planococcus glaciei]